MFTTFRNKFFSRELYQQPIQILISGVVIGFLQLMVAFSLASLLFTGNSAQYLSQGIGLFLITIIASTLLTALISSDYQLFPNIQSSLVLITLGIASAMTIQPGKALIPTLFATISITAIITGFGFYVFGRLNWVQVVRYVPYPVIGGFLAGYGWLLVWAGLSQGQPAQSTILSVSTWIDTGYLSVWLPGLLIGIALLVCTRYSNHFAVIPSILLLSILVIHAWIFNQGWTVTDAMNRGILVSNLNQIEWIPPISLDANAIDWQAIAGQWLRIIMIVVVGLVHMLLNLSSFEVVAEERFDIEKRVQSTGLLNIVIGFLGGHALFHSMSISTLNHKIGTKSPFVYLVASLFIGSIFVFGSQILQLVPVSILSGLLIYLGLGFIDTWVIRGSRQFTSGEHVAALIIMIIVMFVGILQGFFVGIIIMLLFFVASYSQTSIVYRAVSGESLSSTIAHTPYYAKVLPALRREIYIIELTGYIFFGSSNRIVNTVEEYLETNTNVKLRFLVLDFQRVTGLDSSTLLSLRSVIILAKQHKFDLYLSAIDHKPPALRLLSQIEEDRLSIVPSLDEAIGMCERQLLEISGTTRERIPSALQLQLIDLGMEKSDAQQLQRVMQYTRYDSDEVILEQGDSADCIYILELGQVSVFLHSDDGKQIRLQTINMGSIFGEIGFLLNQPRTATIVADTTAIVWTLTRNDLQRLREDAPEIVFAFENMLLTTLAKRIVTSNKLVNILR